MQYCIEIEESVVQLCEHILICSILLIIIDVSNIFNDAAQVTGLPFPPPVLGLLKTNKKITLTGINYASGFSGITVGTGEGINVRFLFCKKKVSFC